MPRRCLHGVHPAQLLQHARADQLCLGAACTGCIPGRKRAVRLPGSLPRRCLHGVHLLLQDADRDPGRFASALPARGASGSYLIDSSRKTVFASALPARGASGHYHRERAGCGLCLGAACTGCINNLFRQRINYYTLPRRCLHGVHPYLLNNSAFTNALCLGAACTGCIASRQVPRASDVALPRRCLHGVHPFRRMVKPLPRSLPRRCLHGVHRNGRILKPGKRALPRRCLHGVHLKMPVLSSAFTPLPRRCLHGVHRRPKPTWRPLASLCLGAACTGCIGKSRQIAAHHFVAYAVSR